MEGLCEGAFETQGCIYLNRGEEAQEKEKESKATASLKEIPIGGRQVTSCGLNPFLE